MIKKKIAIILISTITFIFIVSIGVSLYIYNENKKILDNDEVTLYIYQYEVNDYKFDKKSERTLYKTINFNKNTIYEETITSLDSNYHNTLKIQNGKAYISDANCTYHYCMASSITLGDTLFSNISITCMCSGLYIIVE